MMCQGARTLSPHPLAESGVSWTQGVTMTMFVRVRNHLMFVNEVLAMMGAGAYTRSRQSST